MLSLRMIRSPRKPHTPQSALHGYSVGSCPARRALAYEKLQTLPLLDIHCNLVLYIRIYKYTFLS